MNGAVLVVGAGACSVVLTGLIRWYAAHNGLLDRPNARSSHAVPTPRGGGLAIVIAFMVVLAVLAMEGAVGFKTLSVLSISGGIVAAVGFLDDKFSLRAGVRFAVQTIAAGLFVFAIGAAPGTMHAWGGMRYWVGVGLLEFTLLWSTNLFNFMDGIDGLAGSEAVFVSGAGAYLNYMQHGDAGVTTAMMGLCAASGGFLVWNSPRARIFMGDVGSGFLGLTLPMLALIAGHRASLPMQTWIILFGMFVIDATITLLRRIARGEAWLEPHRLHAYQHLARRWKSHFAVTLLFAAVNLLWLFPWAWYASSRPQSANLSLVAALSPLVLSALLAGSGSMEEPGD